MEKKKNPTLRQSRKSRLCFARMCGVSATVGAWSMSNIAKQYVAKYGIPAVAKKVFIRIQQMNDYLGSVVYTTSAIVPAEEAWPSEAEMPKTTRNHSEPIANP
jgi:hypothetical protein